MKDGFIRVGAVSPKMRVADITGNTLSAIEAAAKAAKAGVKVLSFPELMLTGATAGDLFFQASLYAKCEEALKKFCDFTRELDLISFIGLPVILNSKRYNAVAAVSRGEIVALIPKTKCVGEEARYFSSFTGETFSADFAGQKTCVSSDVIFRTKSLPSMGIAVEVGSDSALMIPKSRYLAQYGANVIINPAASVEIVGNRQIRENRYIASSRDLCLSYVVSEAGFGESGTDGVFAGRCAVYDNGKLAVSSEPYIEGEIVFTEIDTEALMSERLKNPLFDVEEESDTLYYADFFISVSRTHISRPVSKSPFIPEDKNELSFLTKEIVQIQSRALAGRIQRSYSKGAVIGVSGGLDSTLALLVSVCAMDVLGMPRSAVTAITMPCFGTTQRTKGNAQRLSEALGVSFECIDIKESVTRHFMDIGHSPDELDVVYENAQARERTQVLMDVANSKGALVVGTGDLSELALGWATYNGDHMSMYSVNAGVPKTLMRYLVESVAEEYKNTGNNAVADVLFDIIATPVSPELLPPKDGEIAQCTEGIVGPYELHDFFLYYFVKYGFSPKKILRLASAAFAGVYDEEIVKWWLRIFIKRFFSQQFKRSCMPDGPKVLTVGFSPRGDFRMPSDAVAGDWLDF